MAIQGSNTGQLENASKEMIAKALFTMEHTAPNLALVRKFTLPEGSDTMVVPKVGQMTFMNVNETEENTNEMDIGMSTSSVGTSIVGGKVIFTDTLLATNTQDINDIVGTQIGDAAVRRMETDIIALYAALNGGTSLGAAGAIFNVTNVMNVIANAQVLKFGQRIHIIHHPSAVLRLSKDLTTLGAARPIPNGYSQERLQDFFSGIVLGGVPVFATANITPDTNNDAIGVIKHKDALAILEGGKIRRAKVRDEGIGEGAWILYVTHRYSAFEMDDSRGAALTYQAATPATS